MNIFGTIILIIICLSISYGICWYLPRRYNKFVYIGYNIKNPINLKNNLIGFGVFVIGVVFISVSYSNDIGSSFGTALGMLIILFSTYFCSNDIRKSNMQNKHKFLGYFLSVASMLIVVFELLSLVKDIKNLNGSIIGKAFNTGLHGLIIWSFRPELSDYELQRLDFQKANHPNININNMRFLG